MNKTTSQGELHRKANFVKKQMIVPYVIQDGPPPLGAEHVETRGRKSPFPIQDMQVNEWFVAPREMERQLRQSARYHKRKFGIQLQIMLDQAGTSWIVLRVK